MSSEVDMRPRAAADGEGTRGAVLMFRAERDRRVLFIRGVVARPRLYCSLFSVLAVVRRCEVSLEDCCPVRCRAGDAGAIWLAE